MVTGYLNALLAVLIVLELLLLGLQSTGSAETKMQASRNAASEQFSICDTCIKPDIYLIVLDEYAGHVSLKDLFGFDNILFEKQLQQRGFHVVINSTSNYNYTPFSMASMLNMEYLSLQNTDRLQPDLRLAFRMINENKVKKLLTGNGYEFINHSVFNFPKQPAPVEEGFIPFRTRLITSQTLLTRLQRDLGYHLVTTFRIRSVINQQAYRELRNNTKLYDLTMKLANQPRVNPRFVYTHLMMPHYPYYFNKDGAPMDPKRVLPEANNVNRKDYVEYLQYVNKKILHLADHILKSSETPPVILIMSDHGFRHFRDPVSPNYHFMNLNAVWLPDKEYEGFYDGFSNVNQFRTVFNALFGSGFTMLKDSAVYLRD